MLIEVVKIKDECSDFEKAYINPDKIVAVEDYGCCYEESCIGTTKITMEYGYKIIIVENYWDFIDMVNHKPDSAQDIIDHIVFKRGC